MNQSPSKAFKAKKRRSAERAREQREMDARRRGAMFWMLREAGTNYQDLAQSAGLSIERVRQICKKYGYLMQGRARRMNLAFMSEEPFLARLRRAGAILTADRSRGLFDPRARASSKEGDPDRVHADRVRGATDPRR